MAIDEPGAIQILTNEHFPGRFGYAVRYFIVHGTAGFSSAEDVAHYFQHVQASTNYIIGRDGHVVRNVAESDADYGNGIITGPSGHARLGADGCSNGVHDWWWDNGPNPNYISVAAEHVKPSSNNSDHLTPAQELASFTLIRDVCNRHNIPKRWADEHGGITGHFSIEGVGRSCCPGWYPWDRLFAFLAQEGRHMLDINSKDLATYFTVVSPTEIKDKKNGHTVQKGILNFYLAYGGDAFCGLTYLGMPLSEEQGVPGKTNCVVQHFERGAVAYDPKHQLDRPPGAGDVYLMHVETAAPVPPTPAQVLEDSSEQHLIDILKQIEALAKNA